MAGWNDSDDMIWPNWKGETVAIVASGPSAKKAKVDLIRGQVKVIAIKKSIELVPFADVVYGCDAPWWQSVIGLPKFKRLKLAYDPIVCGPEWNIQKIEIPDLYSNKLSFDKIGSVGSGSNSGFQALNLALQFGAVRVLLIGFDANGEDGGQHWYGRNNWGRANNPTKTNYQRWVTAFDNASRQASEMGISIINTSMTSSLGKFQRMTIEGAMQYWGENVT